MVRLSRLADYAVLVMTHIANEARYLHTGPELAAELLLPAPTVSKVLQSLGRAGLLTSHRGVKGGYALSRAPEDISIADIVAAVEGPIALTECIEDAPGDCDRTGFCPTHGNWQVINQAVEQALARISLSEMASPFPVFEAPAGDLSVRLPPRT
jgi:FeS assembly SUF system regulator